MACAIAALHAARDLEASKNAPEGYEVNCECEHCLADCDCDLVGGEPIDAAWESEARLRDMEGLGDYEGPRNWP